MIRLNISALLKRLCRKLNRKNMNMKKNWPNWKKNDKYLSWNGKIGVLSESWKT